MAQVDKTQIYTIKEYTCSWCGYRFTMPVRTIGGQEDVLGRISKKHSTQVKCPYCQNFLKTWDEGEEIGTTDSKAEARKIREER